jgi:hypothetical protein
MRTFFIIYATIVIGFLSFQQVDSLLSQLMLWGYVALWVAGLIMVAPKLRLSSWGGLAALVPLIAILLVQTGFRTAFIVEHGGTDCGTCDGSPMAFLLG